jgi:hypothetical protein
MLCDVFLVFLENGGWINLQGDIEIQCMQVYQKYLFLFKRQKTLFVVFCSVIIDWTVILILVAWFINIGYPKFQYDTVKLERKKAAICSRLFSQYEGVWDRKIHWKLYESDTEANSEQILTSWHVTYFKFLESFVVF